MLINTEKIQIINKLIRYLYAVNQHAVLMLINTKFHALINTKKILMINKLLKIYNFFVLINGWNLVLINSIEVPYQFVNNL